MTKELAKMMVEKGINYIENVGSKKHAAENGEVGELLAGLRLLYHIGAVVKSTVTVYLINLKRAVFCELLGTYGLYAIV